MVMFFNMKGNAKKSTTIASNSKIVGGTINAKPPAIHAPIIAPTVRWSALATVPSRVGCMIVNVAVRSVELRGLPQLSVAITRATRTTALQRNAWRKILESHENNVRQISSKLVSGTTGTVTGV